MTTITEKTETSKTETSMEARKEKGSEKKDTSNGESKGKNTVDTDNNKKGGGKTGKKINENRQKSWKEKEMDARNELKSAKQNGVSKAEKVKIQKKIDHAVKKQSKSENHANKGQGY